MPASPPVTGPARPSPPRHRDAPAHRPWPPQPPRWLAGDWTPWVRDPIDVLRLALLAGAAVTAIAGPRDQSPRLLLTFLVVLLPRVLDLPRPFDLAFVIGMSFQAWGNVGGAFASQGYDKVVHFTLPCAVATLSYLALVRLRVVRDLADESGIHNRVGIVVLTFGLGMAIAGLYEIYEWLANTFLGGHLHVSYGDSISDMLDDGLGALAGGVLIVGWDVFGWGTRRRVPGGALQDDGDAPPQDPIARAASGLVRRLARVSPARSRPRPGSPPLAAVLGVAADVLRASFAAGVLVALAEGRWEAALRLGLTLAATLLVRRLDAPRPFEFAFCAGMAFQAWGDLAHALSQVHAYEAATHVVVSAGVGTVAYLALIRLSVVPDFSTERRIHDRVATALTAFCLAFAAGVLYELYAWLADHALGAHIRVTYDDLIRRLALDALGGGLAAALLVAWDVWGWGTRRRADAAGC